jgi:hypothetical protein
LKFFSSKNLNPLFKALIGNKFAIASIAGINDKAVILSYASWIKAFNRKDGLQIWAVNEKDRFTLKTNSDVIAVNDELRNPISGETFYKYNMNIDRLSKAYIFEHLYTFSTFSGQLYILDIPKAE